MTALKRLGRQEGATLFMLLLAAFDILFHRYTGQTDIVIGTPIANRTRSETNNLIGFFVNTLVLRTNMSGNPSFLELLGRVREIALGAYAHQHLPFERLVEELQPERNLSHTPVFQVMLTLHNAPISRLELPGLDLNHSEIESGSAKFDLNANMQEIDGGLAVAFTYSTDLFDTSSIQRLGQHLKTLLASIVEDADKPLAALSLLTPAERDQILVAWNETRRAYDRDSCLHELFEAQVARTPDALAITFEDQHLTYRQLDDRANQLARHLQHRGVGSEVLVGVLMERSLEMVVALLGIL
jgi:non-ribosomal peptide synthetase component F